ncbi:AraC family transcriptional regulator [Chitinophaga varians]|uniref:AraC family transcriptional regulator n=1 Tax=Chitinophaga varians TaxID=2202339 RepID=UPI00165F339F|nr:helix-turn-helix domain-containing protein [Chitinophaga varians]MBC9909665.1 AraC family transcriptional regulator [Chitinophaga varians]
MAHVANFFRIIILLGAVQGLVAGVLLMAMKKNRLPNRLLAAVLLVLALASFRLYGNYLDWFHSDIIRFVADLLPWMLVMLVGPLVWFYIQASMDAGFRFTKRSRIHFFPVIVDLVPVLTAYGFVIAALAGWIPGSAATKVGIFIDHYNVYSDIPRWISLTAYLWLSVRYLATATAMDQPRYRLLRRFPRVMLVFQALWLLYLIPYVIPRYTNLMLNTFDWYPIYVPLAVMIYWLGIQGFILSYQEVVAAKKNVAPDESISQPALALLKKAMEEDRLFLDPSLNLTSLSEHTGLPAKTISAVLNQCLQKNLNEYINSYRVEAFKIAILLPGSSALTIAGVASDCGFNSLATFQRVFRQLTGLSPSEYRKQAMEA